MFFFFFNDTATTEIYTLSLHDALPIFYDVGRAINPTLVEGQIEGGAMMGLGLGLLEEAYPYYPAPDHRGDRKSTRLNSSHSQISYAVFCLKKKKKRIITRSHLVNSSRL